MYDAALWDQFVALAGSKRQTCYLAERGLRGGSRLGTRRRVPMEVHATVENIYRRARARYGDRAGEMIPAKLYEDDTNTLLRIK
mgnify:CR=1 FL=1